jgi:hypothetical protein
MHVIGDEGRGAVTNMMGDLGELEVWVKPSSNANLLSLSKAQKKYQVTLLQDERGPFFQLIKPDGTGYNFRLVPGLDLYVLDTENPERVEPTTLQAEGEPDFEVVRYAEGEEDDVIIEDPFANALVATVAENKSKYTNEDYSRAVVARQLYKILNRPSLKDYLHIVRRNELPNCPITTADIMRAWSIFGPDDVGALKGKTVRHRPHKVRDVITHHIPRGIIQEYKELTIAGDILHVNGQPLIITMTRKLRFASVEELPSRANSHMIKHFKQLQQLMESSGFRIRVALLDREFEPLRGALAAIGIELNTTGENEHVGDIERFIQTIKERVRAIMNSLPFEYIPIRLAIEMVKVSVFWWNALPVRNGVSDTMSPRTIVTGKAISYDRHCRYEFGEYVQTHEKTTNGMEPRTIGALATRPTGNAQGTWHFVSISSGRVIARNNATKVPMPDHVIQQVHRIARRQRSDPGLVFTDRDNRVFWYEADGSEDENEQDPPLTFDEEDNDDEEDEDYIPEQDEYNYEDASREPSIQCSGRTGRSEIH